MIFEVYYCVPITVHVDNARTVQCSIEISPAAHFIYLLRRGIYKKELKGMF
jgi:hypothetical protein